MTQPIRDSQTVQTLALLTCYGFDLKDSTPLTLIEQWLAQYSVQWIRLAVVEALYLGRYKAVSIDHLLQSWTKRGYPHFHFNHDFERLISHKLPKILLQPLPNIRDVSLPRSVRLELPPPPHLLEPILRKHQQAIAPQTEMPALLGDRDSEKVSDLQGITDIEMILPQWKAHQDCPTSEDPVKSVKTVIAKEVTLTNTEPSTEIALTIQAETCVNTQPESKFDSTLLDRTIHQFSPQPDRSNWFSKLKTVLEQEMAATAS
jgi:hypothetical protein